MNNLFEGELLSLTYSEHSELYEQQIQALLHDDYPRFRKLIGGLAISTLYDSHYELWSITGGNPLSLFAQLPGCWCCASQIEWLLAPSNDKVGTMQRVVLKNAVCHLPSFFGDREKYASYRFSEKELREFKRRQLVARFPSLPTSENES